MEQSSQSEKIHSNELLCEHLLEAGLLSQAQIDVILADQAATLIPVSEIILQRGWIKEKTIAYFIKEGKASVAGSSSAQAAQALKKQIVYLREQYSKLRKIKLALEEEIELLKRERIDKKLDSETNKAQSNINKEKQTTSQLSVGDRLCENRKNSSSDDSIKWMG